MTKIIGFVFELSGFVTQIIRFVTENTNYVNTGFLKHRFFNAFNPEMFITTDFNDTEMFDNELGINFFIAE